MLSLLNQMPGSVAQGLVWGIMAIGVFLTYKILDYADLTVDGSIATGGAVAAMCILGGMNPYLALLCAFLSGMAAGLVTGILHTVLGIPPILSGILTQLALYSVNMRIMGKSNMAVSVDDYSLVVSSRYIPAAILAVGIMTAVLIGVLYWFFGTELGYAIRATGNNHNMARAQGINTNSAKLLGLVLSNGFVALAGGLLAQYNGAADVKMGQGAIVIGLAAVIIGDVLFGKLFRNFALRLLGVVLGAIIYYVIIAIVIWLGLTNTDLKLFSALIVAMFLAVPHLRATYFKRGAKVHA
ncbi:MAG: ABC transporter permease [Pseudoflavonifractor sp.]